MRISRGLLPVLLLVGPVVGILVYVVASGYERERTLAQFEEDVSQRVTGIEAGGRTILEVLHSLRALFDSSERLSGQEFATFTHEALSLHPSIRALEWAPGILEPEREAYERITREQGHPGLITERSADGHLGPASSRPAYYPVTYVQPLAGNQTAVGFDLASEPTRRAALERARATNVASVTDPIQLVQEESESCGFLALLAVRGARWIQGGERTPIGFVVVVFRMDDLVATSLLWDRAAVQARMHFSITDPEAIEGPCAPLASSPEAPSGNEMFSTTRTIELGGQTWRFDASPTALFLSRHRSRQPLLLALLLFLLFESLVGALFVASRRAHDAAAREHAQKIEDVLRSLRDGVIVADKKGRIELANQAATDLVGPAVSGMSLEDWSAHGRYYLPDMETPYPPDQLPLTRKVGAERLHDEDVYVRRGPSAKGRWIRVSGDPIRGDATGAGGQVLVMKDVTERREREEELRRLSSAVEQTADAVVITDRSGLILYVNPAFEAMTGFTRGEVLGKSPRILKSGHHEASFYEALWRRVTGGGVFRGTIVNKKKNGELFHAAQTITPMRGEPGSVTHFVSVLRDMTEERLRERHETELRLAAGVQEQMFPAAPPQADGLDIAGAVKSAEATCGDYYDYLDLPDGSIALVIGDISGHGFGPALLMAQTRAYLRSMLLADLGLAVTFENMNAVQAEDLPVDCFLSLLVARIEPRTGRLTYCNAGHPEGFVLGADGDLKCALTPTGRILGVVPHAEYLESAPITLEEGDVLVLVTDGVTEARSPSDGFFEMDGVVEVARANRGAPARVILDRILEATRAFSAGRQADDDQAVIVCKVTARPTPHP